MLLPVLFGLCSFVWILLEPSEAKNVWILGLSGARLFMAGMALLLTLGAFVLFKTRRKNGIWLFFFAGVLFLASGELLLFSRFPSDDTRNLIPLIGKRAFPLLIAMLLSALCWITALRSDGRPYPKKYAFFLFTAGILIYWPISAHIDRFNWLITLKGNTAMCLLTIAAALLWCFSLNIDCGRGWKTAAAFLFFLVLGYTVTRFLGMWMGRWQTPSSAYWNGLAEAILNGRLDLENPSGTHDLTLYKGKWYVPNPPLPGLLLVPWVALLGSADAVNMCVYSAVLTGICAGLFFLLLITAFTREGTPLYIPSSDDNSYPGNSLSIAVWVTVVFTFGTDLIWLGTTGQMWFISQLLVVLFTLLAVLFEVLDIPPVCSGICLGLAMLSRPSVFPVFFCLLGIWLYRQQEFPRLRWGKTIIRCLKYGIPMVISVALQLLYNKVRFDSWMDFGYVTINGADYILAAVQKWGMFHPHFLRTNAGVMLTGLPRLDFSGERFFFYPYVAGYSVFLMTPPLIYIFRTFRKDWFAVGTWCSVLLTVAMLLLYHNTGAEQIGYRYILDAAAPLSLLTAQGTKGKISPLFKILTVFAVSLMLIAVYWWYRGKI